MKLLVAFIFLILVSFLVVVVLGVLVAFMAGAVRWLIVQIKGGDHGPEP